MQTMREFTVRLPEDLAKIVREKVESGEYPDESAVFADNLQATFPQFDPEVEAWLRTEVVAACEELDADRSQGLSSEQAREFLAVERSRMSKAS